MTHKTQQWLGNTLMKVDGATIICLPCHYEAVLITRSHTVFA